MEALFRMSPTWKEVMIVARGRTNAMCSYPPTRWRTRSVGTDSERDALTMSWTTGLIVGERRSLRYES